jgi:23S rRNA (adenine2503-C2)-methyltransferase
MSTAITSLSRDELNAAILEMGEKPFRAKQIFQWLYQKGAGSYDEMTNLSKQLRQELADVYPLDVPRIVDTQVSRDKTRKYIVECADGNVCEMVAMPSGNRLTVCISSQIGCTMGCTFCATGQEGYTRNLTCGEMVYEVLLAQNDMNMRASNVVVMGQGEPMLNFDNVIEALRILNSPDGLDIGARHMVISTCGIRKGIQALGKIPEQFVLAVSLHSAVQETRNELMPKLAKQNLNSLKDTLYSYQQATGRRISFEYMLIDRFNDNDEHLQALIDFCDGLTCHINLIPLNSVPGSSLKPSRPAAADRFRRQIERSGIPVTVRDSRGSDIAGACGQLKNTWKNQQ